MHITQRNNYTGTGSSLHVFHIWSNDVMLCAKPKAYCRGGEPSSGLRSTQKVVRGEHTKTTHTCVEPRFHSHIGFYICWGFTSWLHLWSYQVSSGFIGPLLHLLCRGMVPLRLYLTGQRWVARLVMHCPCIITLTRPGGWMRRASISHFGSSKSLDLTGSNPDRIKLMTWRFIHVAS